MLGELDGLNAEGARGGGASGQSTPQSPGMKFVMRQLMATAQRNDVTLTKLQKNMLGAEVKRLLLAGEQRHFTAILRDGLNVLGFWFGWSRSRCSTLPS